MKRTLVFTFAILAFGGFTPLFAQVQVSQMMPENQSASTEGSLTEIELVEGDAPDAEGAATDSVFFIGDEGIMVIPPLFEYVTAPEDLPDLQSRTNYLMDNFWNPFDFKKTKVVDQNALNHAFDTYIHAMVYASEDKSMESVKKLVGKIKGNPGLSYQFAKAAEEAFFSPRSEYAADEIYMVFLQNVIDNKKISEAKKKRFRDQMELLKRTAVGAPLPDFGFVPLQISSNPFVDRKEYTLVEFTASDCDDCRYTNLKLDISGVVNDLIEDGRVNVAVVMLDNEEPDASRFPDKWSLGKSADAHKVMDIRILPSFYIIDKNGKIVSKNLHVDRAIDVLGVLTGR